MHAKHNVAGQGTSPPPGYFQTHAGSQLQPTRHRLSTHLSGDEHGIKHIVQPQLSQYGAQPGVEVGDQAQLGP
ncbi:hypothetical protein F751_6469 [Auxenochlorella protothecoides]|uniref:Uncharacterized protein n=1 Tax=Auxenochlorella protothecoides TaxID=3075 RepID=A0A087SB56_AUXPR|nr:hypothetical protein F751_6469 [Auxenochlorella protothecoides]KFM22960.1 hypothetical protein F751_6469 [Auxenochlorella protothecoides]